MTEAAIDQAVPADKDVVIIGGGVVGICAAIYLADAGLSVAVCEKGTVGAEQSSRNWGWIRKAGRDYRELQLMIESAKLWGRLAADVDEDIGYGIRGISYLSETEKELDEHRKWLKDNEGFDHGSRLITRDEVSEILDRTDHPFIGGLHSADDATAEPSLAVPAFSRLAQKKGVTILENCAVRTVESESGQVTGVVTEHGPISCRFAVMAGGAWARTFLENMDIIIPQLAVKGSAMRTTEAPNILEGAAGATRASIRRRKDGGYTVAKSRTAEFQIIPAAFRHFVNFAPVMMDRLGLVKLRVSKQFFGPLGHHRWTSDEKTPFEEMRTLDPEPDMSLMGKVIKEAKALHPALKDVEIAEAWAGMIDVMPDEVPIIEMTDKPSGFVIATGLSGHGFGTGPGVGKLVQQIICSEEPMVDISPFKSARFT
ncbi:Glycine/D-amino acid oxidase [Cohaesibacter sp. ES.047]|uniref:NAD(P)/FAD-dependent oxidoreductase n=1 Tax=Cohaesibacter sp. ES.047 TaxID=1798205 RepID=UPI000BBF5986|nr:FAD-binding oxidoreductase [Cohaesibacter sp. ES.047]SNY90195.1 Glycine/D-amino acid oxidase [Cohaesibacter sp. ES.047]